MSYDDWKLQSPPTNDTQELLKCECCFEDTDEIYTVRVPFRNIIKKEYYCLDCATYFNDNE